MTEPDELIDLLLIKIQKLEAENEKLRAVVDAAIAFINDAEDVPHVNLIKAVKQLEGK